MPQQQFTVEFEDAVFSGIEVGEGLPVVFLHAGVTDKRAWARQMEAVSAAGFRALAYDRRGAGETISDDVPFSPIDDLEAVLDARAVRAAVLVGNSMGGALALDFAIENPERVVGLVLVATAVSGAEQPELPDEFMLMFDALQDAMERGDLDTANKIHAHVWLDGPASTNGRVGGATRELFLVMNGNNLTKALTQEDEPEPAEDFLEDITAPVLLVAGEFDAPNVLATHESLAEELPNAFGIVIENAAHLPALEKPELFNRLLLEFLDAVTGGGAED